MEALQFIGSLPKCGRLCRSGVSSCASHSLRVIFLLVALFAFGWGNTALAETSVYEWDAVTVNNTNQTPTLTLTITESGNSISQWWSGYSFKVGNSTITKALKLQSNTIAKFSVKTGKTATVTIGISTKNNTAVEATKSYVNFDATATDHILSENQPKASGTYTYKELKFNNVAPGEHTITKGGTEMGLYYIKVEETDAPVAAPTADFTYGSTSWASPGENDMTINIPAHKGGEPFYVTLSNITEGATAACSEECATYSTLSGNTLTITAPTSTESAVAIQTTTVTLTNGNASTTYNIKVTTEAKTGITFDPNKRYSQLLIDNRTASFYANTTASGINSTSGTLDYVPGLVAKAMIEAVDYYKDNPAGDITLDKVKGWFGKVQGYGDSHTIKDPGTKGESFDDLNAVKLYFGLKSVAASDKLSGIADNTTGWNEKIKSALGGIKNANTSYVIKSGTGAADMEGGWWHKSKYENQMWCDGQYMGTALLAQMINDDQYKDGTGGNSVTGTKNGDWDLICKQLDITWKYLWNDKTKLIHHAFAADNGSAETSKMWVFDKKTDETNNYRNEACWARAAGWYFLALIDVLEQMDKAKYSGSNYNTIKTHLQTLAAGLKARQDAETGCWYQLPLYDGTYSATDCGNEATKTRVYNYLESSATAIFAASYLKGIRLGYLDKNTYEETAKKAYKGIIEHFMTSDNNIYWSSRSAGLGTATSGKRLRTGSNAYYLKGFDVVPTKVTDNGTSKDETGTTTLVKGTEGKVLGAMILAAVEYERAYMSNVDLVVDVPDVTMYTTASEVTQPSVTVYALVNGENVALTAGTHYTVAYTVKTAASPSNVTGGNSITVAGTSGKYTAGNNVITVTVTPTQAGVNAYHCKATAKDFNYNVVTAGEKLTPTVVVSDNISYRVSTPKDVTVSVKYDGNDITDLFNFGYKLSTTAYGLVSSNANVFTFTPGSTVYSGIILTITATPIDAYADQYYTVEKTCTLNIVDKALAVVAELSATNVNIGENIYFTSVTVKDNEGKILSIDDGECTVEYQSSAPSVLAINASTGVMTPLAEGETTVKVIARKDKDGYASASWTQTVTVIDPTVYKVKSGETAPINGTVVTDVEGMAMTYGGWMFEPGISRTVTNAAGTNTESKEYFGEKNGTSYGWGKAATDGAGSLSNFKYSFMGNSHQNPRDEMGANALPEGYYNIGYQGHDNIKPIDPMFNVPVEGAYITFAPKTNGTVIAHVLQEGAFSGSYNSAETDETKKNKLIYRRDRRVMVLDEMGQLHPNLKATLDVTTGKLPKDANPNNNNTIITDVKKYKKLDKDSLSTDYDFTKDFVGFTNFTYDENSNITNFQNGLYKFYGNKGNPNYGTGDGWGVLVKAPVTYEFEVKAGKTYYLYNYGSKINVFGFQFKPDANVVVDNVEYKEQQDNTITSTPEGHVASVSLDRKFVVDKWNAAVLPFSLNKQQVDAIFGTTYDKDHPKGTQILYFEKTQGKYVYYTRHAYNTIVAGKPFLIKPTGKIDDKTTVATLSDGYIVLNTSKIEKFPYVTIEGNLASEWGRGKESADYVWKSDYNVQAIEPNDYYINSSGNLIMREGTNAKVQSFRGFLKKKSNTASAKLFSVAYFDLLSDNADIPSKIEDLMMDGNGNLINVPHDGMIYNLNGQVISTDPASLHSLPKGIYILNGKKYVVE